MKVWYWKPGDGRETRAVALDRDGHGMPTLRILRKGKGQLGEDVWHEYNHIVMVGEMWQLLTPLIEGAGFATKEEDA